MAPCDGLAPPPGRRRAAALCAALLALWMWATQCRRRRRRFMHIHMQIHMQNMHLAGTRPHAHTHAYLHTCTYNARRPPAHSLTSLAFVVVSGRLLCVFGLWACAPLLFCLSPVITARLACRASNLCAVLFARRFALALRGSFSPGLTGCRLPMVGETCWCFYCSPPAFRLLCFSLDLVVLCCPDQKKHVLAERGTYLCMCVCVCMCICIYMYV